MIDLGTLYMAIKVDDAEAKKSLAEIKNGAKDTSTEVSKEQNKAAEATKAKMTETTDKIKKTCLATTAAVVATVGKITKSALDAYADYEQLQGGVQKIFGDNAEIVIKNAEQAYKTAGVSANQYMEQITSFSASLLQSVGGDTKKAAEIGDMAIQDMADNANTFGSSMKSIQDAYQGFAKQNYTMLDNLKLGYGGTRQEMERLLADAEKLTGKTYNINNLKDIYEAIHVIQEEMKITGTTMREAEKTISGSIASMKASYTNWLTSLASGENVDVATKNLVHSIHQVANNIKPVIGQVISSIFKEMPGLGAAGLAGALGFTGLKTAEVIGKIKEVSKTVKEFRETCKGDEFAKLTETATKINAWTAAAVAITAVGVATKAAYDKFHKFRMEANEMVKTNQENVASVQASALEAEIYAGKLTDLANVENKSTGQISLMGEYINKLNQLYPELNLAIDENTGKVTANGEEVKNLNKYLNENIATMKEAALQKAYQENLENAAQTYANTTLAIEKQKDAIADLQVKQSKYQPNSGQWKVYQEQIDKASASLEDMKKSTETTVAEMNESLLKINGFKNVEEAAKDAGVAISKSLADSVKKGTMALPSGKKEWQKAMKLQDMVDAVESSGKEISGDLASALADGNWDEALKLATKECEAVEKKAKKTKPDMTLTAHTDSKFSDAKKKYDNIKNKTVKATISAVLTGLNDKVKQFLGLRIGLQEVPYDNFPALLHKGETILTAAETNQYRKFLENNKGGLPLANEGEGTTNITNDNQTNYYFGDITVDVSELKDIPTVESFVNMLTRAKAYV